jgi:hypothetical protein
MTTIALRALTVLVALGAALSVLTGTALAEDAPSMCTDALDCPGPDTCEQAGMDYDGTVPVCVARQLPEEAIGGARCPDPGQVVVAVRADGSYVCGSAVDTVPVPSGVGQTPEGGSASARPQPAVPAPATAAPADDRGVRTPQARPTAAGTAPTAQPSRTVPVADQLTDLWAQLLDWIRMFLGGSI